MLRPLHFSMSFRNFFVAVTQLTFGKKWAWAPKGLGPQDPTKKLAHWVDLLGQPISRKTIFKNFLKLFIIIYLKSVSSMNLMINYYIVLIQFVEIGNQFENNITNNNFKVSKNMYHSDIHVLYSNSQNPSCAGHILTV